MADNTNPSANNGKTSDLLPRFYRSDSNKKFLQATTDQLAQPGTVNKINGFIGRQNSKASTADDVFVKAPTAVRQRYQLEPGITVKDELGNTKFFKDYQDYINQLTVFGAVTANHAPINKQEFYSWDPHIDWDKFTNFQQYYWLPFGPDLIRISGKSISPNSTFTVQVETVGAIESYVISPDGITHNPSITLYKGQTYTFNVDSISNPFAIKTVRSFGASDLYDEGVINNRVEQGTLTFTVPYSAPDVLFYMSTNNLDLGGVFLIKEYTETTYINVDEEIVGKQYYTLPNGTELSNGMKIAFDGVVEPTSYSKGQYYVEGVGEAIVLVSDTNLDLVSAYTESAAVLFDDTPFDSFPFSDASSYAKTPDYIVINRRSRDHNPWSRYNRWFHKDIIDQSAAYNNKIADVNQAARAVRPIIEFEPNLKLFNFGSDAIPDVDLVDTYTTDVFSKVEGQLGYNIDGIPVVQGQRILFTADTDLLVKNRIYKVEFVDVLHTTQNGVASRQIHLVPQEDPELNQVVLVKQGVKNQGLMYWYNGSSWALAQQKQTLNQPPLFDVVDENGVSYGDTSVYDGSSFAGTKIFSYKIATSGVVDPKLGFKLTYRNISNIGDIVFTFNLSSDTFVYKNDVKIATKKINAGMLVKSPAKNVTSYVNGWQISSVADVQPAVRIYKGSQQTNNFNIDIFDNISNLSDLKVKIYVNEKRLAADKWTIVDNDLYKMVVLASDISTSDILTIRTVAKQPINENGHYELPINLHHNPLNSDINEFTLGEVYDHVASIVDNAPRVVGEFPGATNLRDLGNVTQYGTKFVQHSGPGSLAMYHIASKENNIIKAIEQAQNDYTTFKRNFINVAESLGIDASPVKHVNAILAEINKDKQKTSPYYFSDMVGNSAYVVNDFPVIDYRIKKYPLSSNFTLLELSNAAIYIYLNEEQLIYGKDYTFDGLGFVEILATIANDDTISIYEYENTDGCFIPATPTKLGIWPKYEPKIYTDTSLITPRTMIQGHDGSHVLAYGDFRDDLILELEKRIYNNIKVQYDANVFDIYDFIPGYNRDVDYTLSDFNSVLAPYFYKWTSLVDRDFTKPLSFDRGNSMTFNYRGHAAPDGREVPGYWRGVYRWLLDTDRPHSHPWEMLGFSIEPLWWTEVYGPAPYTKDNTILWKDLTQGVVREPGKPVTKLSKFERPFLLDNLPVGDSGELISPMASGLAAGSVLQSSTAGYIFGDVSPIEATWRRSSYYPFAMLLTMMLMQPARLIGLVLDRSRIVRNLTGQLVYKDTGVRITPSDVVFPSTASSTTRVQTSGIINYLIDYIVGENQSSLSDYFYNLANLNSQVTYRVGGFTSKEKFNLLLESKPPTSTSAGNSSVFIPQEDYEIILNTSNPITKITYSGIIITKLEDGFDIKGYSKTHPYFKYYPWVREGIMTNVGGISESFTEWTPGQQYAAGKIVVVGNRYYRAKTLHSATSFSLDNFQSLPSLPIVGGRDAYIRTEWDRTESITVPYGTKLRTIQDVVDFIIGYGEYLKDQGFIFDDFNAPLAQVSNWVTSAKEFMFWTTQNWSTGQDKWSEWLPNTTVTFGDIVRYNGDYYRAIRTIEATDIFSEEDNYVKLSGLSTVGSSVISLSPSANKLTFKSPLAVVDNIGNYFNDYEIFKVDGTPIPPASLNSYRGDGIVTYAPVDDNGIYSASFYLVQKEQVVIINNTTMFNDTIFNPGSGYKQDRIKLAGYVTTDWTGAFEAPGFIFDQANISDWAMWQDYALGDIVKHKEFYYTSKGFTQGTEQFEQSSWYKLDKKPTAQLLPNWSYKAGQFEDFYSLDSDNFDGAQQKMAQHLVGYQKRQYLENIIKDDVSEFKFYQGMIIEKGTQNSLNKLFNVLGNTTKDSISFHEEWALRVGQYGASSSYENIEFILDEAEFKGNPQAIELVNTVDPTVIDYVYRQVPTDLYVKPIGYNNNPWPTSPADRVPFLRSAGHVRLSDAKVAVATLDNLLTIANDDFKNGDYIWVGFEGVSWNVYRYTGAGVQVQEAQYDGVLKILTVTLSTLVPFTPGEYIAFARVGFNGFYKIETVELDTFTINADLPDWQSPFTEQLSTVIFKLVSHKFDSIDNLPADITSYSEAGELIWTGGPSITSGEVIPWATWEYNPVYQITSLVNNFVAPGLEYGRATFIDASGTIMGVSTKTGEIVIYDKVAGKTAPWILRETIDRPAIAKDALYGNPNANIDLATVTASSPDSRWLAVASPLAGSAATSYKGTYNSNIAYHIGDEVKFSGQYYKAIAEVPAFSAPPTQLYWKKIRMLTVDIDNATSIGPLASGAVTIYEKDKNNNYSLVATVLSPNLSANEKFGSSLAFTKDKLLVGAEGYNSNTGIVYQLVYSTIVRASSSYNPTGSSLNTIRVSSTANIEQGMAVVGTGFTSGQVVGRVVDSTTLILSGVPDSPPSGVLNFTTTSWGYDTITESSPPTVINSPLPAGSKFGNLITVSFTNDRLLISAPSIDTNGKVLVYNGASTGQYSLIQTITGVDPAFGQGITISNSGLYIAISSVLDDTTKINQGAVFVYKFNSTTELYDTTPVQKLVSPRPEAAGYFGGKISFTNDYDTLVVYSQAADDFSPVTFDNNTTTFDGKVTKFKNVQVDNGQIFVFDRYETQWVFSETLDNPTEEGSGYGSAIAVTNDFIVVGAPYDFDQNVMSGKVYEYRKASGSKSWSVKHHEIPKPDLAKIKKAFLYNKKSNKVLAYLDVIDPAQGKIAGIAEQELKYKTFYDPAIYTIGNDTVNIDDGMAWGAAQVGMLWWDLRTAKFVDSYDDDILYRNSSWNTLFPGASIDIYEWVESTLLPSQWLDYTDTELGLTMGISGKPLYDDSIYAARYKFDTISNSYTTTYYFWVKNKRTVPDAPSRKISAKTVANLIEHTRGEGYKYIGITGTSSFTLVNVKPLLEDKDVVLSVEYWLNEFTTQNIHSEWKLISNTDSSTIPANIEVKWFDSLCGKDTAGRVVPDPKLSPKLRYGIENRPRQGMFVNRFEALKQFVERANLTFAENQIANSRDISGLESYEAEPTLQSGVYDIAVDTDAELRFASVGSFVRPKLTPVIVDGTITGVNIINRGSGFLTAPTIEVSGEGIGAELKTTINAKGWITGVTVINGGKGYVDGTTVTLVRDYCVLVHNDSGANGTWSVYSYDPTYLTWSRVQSQAYDTRKYWKYIDWYATGYNQFTKVDYSINTFADLNSISTEVSNIVKIRSTNSGNWLLLEKYAESSSVDWTQQYRVVGSQNGTIQLLPTLYEFKDTTYGFDGQLFDGGQFDNLASEELRYVLTSIKDDLLIDDLKSKYLELFFTSIRYALSEQNYLDWVFKTSFVKAEHNLPALDQSVTYNADNLSNYEDYINEVKPYRTKVREYVSAYNTIESSELSTTDFDLMPSFTNGSIQPINAVVQNGSIIADNADINVYPWKHWKDNVGFVVTELRITDGGSGYEGSPKITITSDSGVGATAAGFVANGSLTRLVLISQGSGYLSAPTVTISGGHGAQGGTNATAVAYIGSSLIRSNLIKMKFDRITPGYFISQLTETESFVGEKTRVQWPLKWSPDTRVGKTVVKVKGVDVLADSYKIVQVKSTAKGYTSYSGSIVFNEPVEVNAPISVTYVKDWALLSAADRIQYYYTPGAGELGKDLSQLMTGIDYGGVIVNGLDFNVSGGWGSVPYYSDKWDSFDSTFDDYIVTVNAGTSFFPPTPNQPFPASWEVGTALNVYHAPYNIDSWTVTDPTETVYTFNLYDVAPIVKITKVLSTTAAVARGTYVLTVSSTTGLKVGDVVTIAPINDLDGHPQPVLNLNTTISKLTSTQITLNQIVLLPLSSGTNVTFTRTLVTPTDCVINGNGTVVLTEPATLGSVVSIESYVKPIRVDVDGQYTYTGNSYIVDIASLGLTVNANDQFIIRKSTSDGSVKPQEQDYDTALSGGDLAYSSATGIAPEDIIVDGDGFVTPTSSPATEEVVPGQIVDSVAIKVFDKPNNTSALIKVDSHIADGTNTDFALTQKPNSKQAVIVKVSSGTRNSKDTLDISSVVKYENVDYTVDYNSQLVKFNNPPAEGDVVSLFSFGFAGSNILDLDYFIADGETTEFITRAPWVTFTGVVYEAGEPAVVTFFKTDDSYSSPGKIGIRFASAPAADTIVNYILTSGSTQTYSITKTEKFTLTTERTYPLANTYGDLLPIESSLIVKLGNGTNFKILEAPNNATFTVGTSTDYTLDPMKFRPFEVDISGISAIIDNKVLRPGLDYTVDLGGITVSLSGAIRKQYVGYQLTVSVRSENGYTYNPPVDFNEASLTINDNVIFAEGDTLEVTGFYKHDVLDIERTSVTVTNNIEYTADTPDFYDYKGLTSGRIKLDRAVIDDQYVMVTKNGDLLTPGVDFKLNKSKKSIKLAVTPDINDKITVITFSSNVVTSGIAYMQFKDMLNRTHFKRLSLNKQARLVTPLELTSTSFEVSDASNFDAPNPAKNKPGVVEIHGERIEYFALNGNVLSQLRRGTLGTGTPTLHKAGTPVQDIGASETLPYHEETVTEHIVSDGTNIVQLGFSPSIVKKYNTQHDHDSFEVFVGGYDTNIDWAANVAYSVGTIVNVGSYTYKCNTAHTSTELFRNDIAKWSFFVGNIRLKKAEYKVHNVNIAPDSPEGDVTLPADFTLNTVDAQIQLATPLKFGTKLTVVKRVGTDFDGEFSGNIMNSNSKIASFLKSTPGIGHETVKKPSLNAVVTTFDSSIYTFDNTIITFDQGN